MKRYLLMALLGAALALTTIILFERGSTSLLYLNMADDWGSQLRQTHKNCIIMTGDSSGRLGVDGELLLREYDIPLINTNINAGNGHQANAEIAFDYLQSGDTLLLCCGLPLYQEEYLEPTTQALKLLRGRLGWRVLDMRFIPFKLSHLRHWLMGDSLAQGTYVQRLLMPKLLEGGDKYSTLHPSGWREMPVHFDSVSLPTPQAFTTLQGHGVNPATET